MADQKTPADMHKSSDTDGRGGPGLSPRMMVVGLVALGLLLLVLLIMMLRSAANERARETAALVQQQALIASSRLEAVQAWIDDGASVVAALAANPSVQVYTMAAAEPEADATAAGQVQYLENLLQVSAQRGGFLVETPAVPANVERAPGPGLAIISAAGTAVARVGGPLPDPRPLMAQRDRNPADPVAAAAMAGSARLGDAPALGYLAGLNSPAGLDELPGSGPASFIYGVRALQPGLATRLAQPGDPFRTGRTLIVDDNGIVLAAAPDDGIVGSDASTLLAAARQPDTQTSNVIAVARDIDTVGWTLLRTVDTAEAIGPIDERWTLRLAGLSGLAVLLAALLLLTWRHAAARRAAQEAQAARAAAEREETLRAFLQTLADAQPTLIAVADTQQRLTFSNAQTRGWLNLAEGARAAPLAALFGPIASEVTELLEAARSQPEATPEMLTEVDGRRLSLRAVGLPSGDTLLVGHDVSALLLEQERRAASLRALINTLTGLIDARDPGSAHHSEKVSLLAEALGGALDLPAATCTVLRQAGLLMNIGKILVPRAILIKTGPLSAAEQATVQQALQQSARLLEQVPFDGPVATTLAQLDAAEPSLPARIVRLANAFVSMVSPRAFRPAMTVEAALAQLRSTAQPQDSAILSALAHFLDNRGGRIALGLDAPGA